MTPTARSLDKLRKDGYTACVVEKWVPSSPAGFKGPIITRDAFNFGDILCCRIGTVGATLVQTTAGTNNAAARLQKIRGIAEAGVWLASGNRIQIHAWRKMGGVGKRKLWDCRVVDVDAELLKAP